MILKEQTIVRPLVDQFLKEYNQDYDENLKVWFHKLSPKHREAAIALALFNGLFDDQFFEVTERLVDEVWERRDTLLRALDYVDLDTLFAYFSQREIDEQTALLQERYPDQQRWFLDMVWNSHRRLILSTLPCLVTLAKQATENKETKNNWILYGTTVRREYLLNVIANLLNKLGIRQISLVESSLLELASSSNFNTRMLAARALSRWLNAGREDELFAILESWESQARVIEIVKEFMRGGNYSTDKYGQMESPTSIIQGTIALTLGVMALEYEPNTLPKRFIELLKKIAKEGSKQTKELFFKAALPRIMTYHFRQVAANIKYLKPPIRFVKSFAKGVAYAYENKKEDVREIMEKWISQIQEKDQLRTEDDGIITQRDLRLITVIYALAEIKYSTVHSSAFTASMAYDMILDLQEKERHNVVNGRYVEFVLRQLQLQPSEIDPKILQIIKQLSAESYKRLSSQLVEMYLYQRRRLKNGNYTFKHQGLTYQVWEDEAERPVTKIEQTVRLWLLGSDEVGQQLAYDCIYQFVRRLDVDAYTFVSDQIDKEEAAKEEVRVQPEQIPPAKIIWEQSWLSWIISKYLQVRLPATNSNQVRNLVPLLIGRQVASQDELEAMADKISMYEDSKFHSTVVLLRNFLKYREQLKWIAIGTGAIVLFLIGS